MWSVIDIFLNASVTYRYVLPEMVRVAAIGYAIVLVLKFILCLLGRGAHNE